MLNKISTAVQYTPAGRVYNFGAGPAMLPVEVMQRAQSEFMDWHGTGMSVMEMSHRSDEFMSIAGQTESDLREILQIPQNYRVLFLQGGASSQFAMVPMNLSQERDVADYFHTGHWSGKALKEARKFCKVNVSATDEKNGFTSIPAPDSWLLNPDSAYVYYTANETINGVEFHFIPDVGDIPLVTDMTSNLLTRPLDVSCFGIIFAGAQKNIGPSGLVVVIVREDLIGKARQGTPSMYDYAVQTGEKSMYNTPPTYSWYMAGLVMQWIMEQGGLIAMEEKARRKSEKLYRVIDNSDFYNNNVDVACRSRLNVPFSLADETLYEEFIARGKAAGLVALAGHRSVGGLRASIYNAMPEEGVDRLIEFMRDFEKRYG
ncbi:MAG: 3-phosphoserine/phosphohydroxythreonine transaminase [Gammaproteobacteria bacterium]|nr:3-phosphoserine/phosphohydroxythreonine transaminase [Gammaproteobacteria bacterium]